MLPGEDIRAFQRLFGQVLGDYPQQVTKVELSILQFLLRGATRRNIARELHFSSRTVDRYIQAVYRKLNASGQMDAILRALLWGYLTSPLVHKRPVHDRTDLADRILRQP